MTVIRKITISHALREIPTSGQYDIFLNNVLVFSILLLNIILLLHCILMCVALSID